MKTIKILILELNVLFATVENGNLLFTSSLINDVAGTQMFNNIYYALDLF